MLLVYTNFTFTGETLSRKKPEEITEHKYRSADESVYDSTLAVIPSDRQVDDLHNNQKRSRIKICWIKINTVSLTIFEL